MNTGYQIVQAKPNYMLTFHKENKTVGLFDFNEGRMHFEGDVSESGKVFVDWVIKSFQQRIDDAVNAEREACAKVCEDEAWRCKKIAIDTQNKQANASAIEASICASAIRARGNT